jgi:transcriptional regulator with XRE-family HTH domain
MGMLDKQLPLLFGTALRRLRAEFGWTQEHLAEVAELNKNFISKLERGEQQPSLASVYILANAFGRKGSDILLDIEDLALKRKERNKRRE